MVLLDMFRKRDDGAPKEEVTTPIVSDVLLQALIRQENITRDKALTVPAVSGAVGMVAFAPDGHKQRHSRGDGTAPVSHSNTDRGNTGICASGRSDEVAWRTGTHTCT